MSARGPLTMLATSLLGDQRRKLGVTHLGYMVSVDQQRATTAAQASLQEHCKHA